MSNIAQIQSSDTFDFQRKRINDAIDIVNSMGGGIAELESEANLPDPSTATSNIYLIRNHTKFKGAALAALINGVYKITPLKNDVMNSNQYVYINADQLSSLATINKCVYLDSTGKWQLADPSDPNKYAQGIVGPYNSIILGGVLYSPSLNLTKGATYYYDSNGSLTTQKTIGKVGVALDTDTLSLHFLTIDNLNFQDKETAVNYGHITNCITHIPQDIQIQTNGETCTLKAGSKVYIPNGDGVFNEIIISTDISNTGAGTDSFVITDGKLLLWTTSAFSGTTAPSAPVNGTIWYDTANNLVKRFSTSSGSWLSGYSLPVALFNSQDNSKTKIFNGFGYIGSTIFALPGVKCLIPNGRNVDGTLNNKKFTVPNPFIGTITTDSYSGHFVLATTGINIASNASENQYDSERNIIYNKSSGNIYSDRIIAGFRSVSNGKIESLTAKTAFRAVDNNDFKLVSKNNDGLVPQLPNETTVKKFFRQDGTWAVPPQEFISPKIVKINITNGGTYRLTNNACNVIIHENSYSPTINPPSDVYSETNVNQLIMVYKCVNGVINLSNSFKWVGGPKPTFTANKMHILLFQQLYDGSWYGNMLEEY